MDPRVPEPAPVGDAQGDRYEQAVGEQVERPTELVVHPGAGGGLGIGLGAQIQVDELDARLVIDRLERSAGGIVTVRDDARRYQPHHARPELAGDLSAGVGE